MSTACLECPAGNTTDTLGEVGATTCSPCAAGRFDDDQSSATACTACSGGKADTDDNPVTPCDSCEPGYYSASEATVCSLCPPGYVDEDADPSTPCDTSGSGCRAGTHATAGSTECTNCTGEKLHPFVFVSCTCLSQRIVCAQPGSRTSTPTQRRNARRAIWAVTLCQGQRPVRTASLVSLTPTRTPPRRVQCAIWARFHPLKRSNAQRVPPVKQTVTMTLALSALSAPPATIPSRAQLIAQCATRDHSTTTAIRLPNASRAFTQPTTVYRGLVNECSPLEQVSIRDVFERRNGALWCMPPGESRRGLR